VLLWDQGAARAVVLAREGEAGDWLGFDLTPEQFQARVAEVGHVPLPPYLERPDTPEDRARYQTVYAREEGAVAAPTAGLHFTPELLHELRALGVETREVILHVGPGTFRPVKADEVQEHRMDPEPYGIPPATAAAVNAAKRAGRRVLAVGSTSLRTLESAWDRATDSLTPGPGVTRLYAYPPYDFRVCDGLLTNFHLPKSTLFMLICAYLAPGRTDGIQRGQALYAHAIQEHYRFYSYGDACLFI
jgi:S-adenosylmethionine:tRNA ribosyltransferase-isomerase